MPRTIRFITKEGEIASNVMDGEVILINLGNGTYYTMGGVGDRVWALIQKRATLDELCQALTKEYDVPMGLVKAEMTKLTEQLLSEGLIGINRDTAEAVTVDSPTERLKYTSPELKKFDDMAEMFALDPPLPVLPKNDKK
ncbi:MAG: PqqD family protein [Pirellulaceae bacterium]|nr:PqqD family protein [Pirellulaceae bacterium]